MIVTNKTRKILFIVLGCISLILAGIGAVLPLLPTFPFVCLTAYFFGKSSKRLDNWFKQTKLYKTYLESYAKGEGMTIKIKIKVLCMISLLLLIGFITMKNVPIGRIVLIFVWLFHLYYFIFIKNKV